MTFNGTEFDDDFDNAEVDDGFKDVPSGTYQAVVERAIFDVPKYELEGHPSLQLTCKIIAGECAGSCVFPKAGTNPDFIHYLKSMLVKMGYEVPPKPSQIGDELEGMLDRVLEVFVTKKNDKGFQNCYVNSFVRMSAEGDGESKRTVDPTGTW